MAPLDPDDREDRFIGKLRERYGWSRDEAERSAREYFDNLS